jgi:hypothetical protein
LSALCSSKARYSSSVNCGKANAAPIPIHSVRKSYVIILRYSLSGLQCPAHHPVVEPH